jgi:hypothetical protein
MNEEMLFHAGLEDDGLTIDIDRLEGAFPKLAVITNGLADKMTAGITHITDALDQLGTIGSNASSKLARELGLTGDARFGLDLLDPVARENIFRQMARDWADAMKMQGAIPDGYASTP